MASERDFRKIALSLEGTIEAPHFDRTAFKVARIYATLPRDGETANLLFSIDDQDKHCADAPEAFAPVPGGWGRMGYTTVTLGELTVKQLEAAMRIAWTRALPKPKKRVAKKR